MLDRDAQGRDTPFIKNRDKFLRGLAATNPDNFLYNFRDAFGQPQPEGATAARRMGQPDDEAARARERPLPVGHRAGVCEHRLRPGAAGELPAEDELPDRHAVRPVAEVGQARATRAGRRSPIRPRCRSGPGRAELRLEPPGRRDPHRLLELGHGLHQRLSARPVHHAREAAPPTARRTRQIWAPYYTLHKILAGLLDSYEVGGNKKALEIAEGMGAWVNARLKALPPETRISMWSRYIAGEYGGMNEVDGAPVPAHRRPAVPRDARSCSTTPTSSSATPSREHGLAKNVDTIRGKHANQHIPQITGALETFRNTQELPYYLIADELLGDRQQQLHVQHRRRGRRAESEQRRVLHRRSPTRCGRTASRSGGQNETCATYNLLKLDRQLFMYDQTAKYMDHYERALYNHILASVAEERRRQHLPRAAQPRRAEAVRQRRHERLHLLQRHGAREQHQAAGLDLLPQRRQPGALREPVHSLDADLDRAQGRRAAGHRLPVRRHDQARRQGQRGGSTSRCACRAGRRAASS